MYEKIGKRNLKNHINLNIYIYIYIYIVSISTLVKSAEGIEYNDCISGEGKTQPPISVLDMTQNHLMVKH